MLFSKCYHPPLCYWKQIRPDRLFIILIFYHPRPISEVVFSDLNRKTSQEDSVGAEEDV